MDGPGSDGKKVMEKEKLGGQARDDEENSCSLRDLHTRVVLRILLARNTPQWKRLTIVCARARQRQRPQRHNYAFMTNFGADAHFSSIRHVTKKDVLRYAMDMERCKTKLHT